MKFTITINGKTHDFNQSVMAQLLGDLHTITNPRMVVVVTAGFLELFTNTLIEARCKNQERILSDSRTYPWSAKKVLLHEIGVISDDELALFDWFRKIRNRAAHRAFFDLTPDVLGECPKKPVPTGDSFRDFCTQMLLDWMNQHCELKHLTFSDAGDVKKKERK